MQNKICVATVGCEHACLTPVLMLKQLTALSVVGCSLIVLLLALIIVFFPSQVTTLLSRYDKALASGVVSEQQLQQLQQQVSNQGSILRAAKEAAKAVAGDADSKAQVTSGAHLQFMPHQSSICALVIWILP